MTQNNGWQEWSRHVLAELRRLNDNFSSLEDKLDEHKEQQQILLHGLDIRIAVVENQIEEMKATTKMKTSHKWALLIGITTGMIGLGAAIIPLFFK